MMFKIFYNYVSFSLFIWNVWNTPVTDYQLGSQRVNMKVHLFIKYILYININIKYMI